MDKWKSRGGKSQRREEKRREEKRRSEKIREDQRRSEKRKSQKESERVRKSQKESERVRRKMQVREKVESRETLLRGTFGSWDVEKVHAVVARSTFPSQNAQNTSVSDHFGAKHISKSKCAKHVSVGPLLEVEMSKKCPPLWREAHFEVKCGKNWGVRNTFGRSDTVLRHKGFCTLPVSKTWRLCGSINYDHYATLRSNNTTTTTTTTATATTTTTLHYTTTTTTTTITTTTTTLRYATLHYTTLH